MTEEELKLRARARLRLQQGGVPAVSPEPTIPQQSRMLDAGDTVHEFVGGISEPIAKFASGMVAKPVSDVAGLVKGGMDAVRQGVFGNGQNGMNAQEMKDFVQKGLTYEPRTESGKSDYNPLNAFGNAVGSIFHAISPDSPEEAGVSPTSLEGAVRLGAREAIPQAIGIAGIKYGPQVANSVGQASKRGAQKLMVSALKPTPTQMLAGDGDIAAQQMLKRGINPNTAGVVEINKIIDDLHSQVESSIAGSTGTVNKQAVIDSLERVKNDFMYKPNLEANQARIAKAGDEFGGNPIIPDEAIPVQTAQKLKRGYQKSVADDYGQESTAGMEANKAIAAKLRQDIEGAHPEVAPLNAEQAKLITTLGVLERRAAQNRTADPVPTAGMLRGVPAWAAMAADKSSMFKARVAQAMDSMGNKLSSNATPGPEPLSLAPVGEPLVPPTPQGPMPQGRGLLGFADEGQIPVRAEPQMPTVEMPLEARLAAMYQRGGVNEGPKLPPAPPTEAAYPGGIPYVTSDMPPTLMPSRSIAERLPALIDENGNPIPTAPGTVGPETGLNIPPTPNARVEPGGVTKRMERKVLNALKKEPQHIPDRFSIEEMTADAVRNRNAPEQGVDFMGKTEFWQQPAMKQATEAFIQRAEELKSIINNKYPIDGRKQVAAAMELRALEKEFGAGAKLGGLRGPSDAYTAVYQAGDTQLPIQKTFDPRITEAILGRR